MYQVIGDNSYPIPPSITIASSWSEQSGTAYAVWCPRCCRLHINQSCPEAEFQEVEDAAWSKLSDEALSFFERGLFLSPAALGVRMIE